MKALFLALLLSAPAQAATVTYTQTYQCIPTPATPERVTGSMYLNGRMTIYKVPAKAAGQSCGWVKDMSKREITHLE